MGQLMAHRAMTQVWFNSLPCRSRPRAERCFAQLRSEPKPGSVREHSARKEVLEEVRDTSAPHQTERAAPVLDEVRSLFAHGAWLACPFVIASYLQLISLKS